MDLTATSPPPIRPRARWRGDKGSRPRRGTAPAGARRPIGAAVRACGLHSDRGQFPRAPRWRPTYLGEPARGASPNRRTRHQLCIAGRGAAALRRQPLRSPLSSLDLPREEWLDRHFDSDPGTVARFVRRPRRARSCDRRALCDLGRSTGARRRTGRDAGAAVRAQNGAGMVRDRHGEPPAAGGGAANGPAAATGGTPRARRVRASGDRNAPFRRPRSFRSGWTTARRSRGGRAPLLGEGSADWRSTGARDTARAAPRRAPVAELRSAAFASSI